MLALPFPTASSMANVPLPPILLGARLASLSSATSHAPRLPAQRITPYFLHVKSPTLYSISAPTPLIRMHSISSSSSSANLSTTISSLRRNRSANCSKSPCHLPTASYQNGHCPSAAPCAPPPAPLKAPSSTLSTPYLQRSTSSPCTRPTPCAVMSCWKLTKSVPSRTSSRLPRATCYH